MQWSVLERSLRRSLRRARGWMEQMSPARLVPLGAPDASASVALVCVYRARHVASLLRLLSGLPAGTEVRLWALDEVMPELADLTVGCGPGGRLELLNRIVETLPRPPDVLVVTDDDVSFVVGDFDRLLRAQRAMGFDVCQPAHSARSITAFRFVRRHRLRFARETTFVEQGPLLLLSAAAQAALLPFPEDMGMGWGIEARWHATALELDLRLGIIDAVSIQHVRGQEHTYDTGPELAQLRRELDALGIERLEELQQVRSWVGLVGAAQRARGASRRSARAVAMRRS